MPRRTLTKSEQAYIEAHKHNAEEALKLLINDVNHARLQVASYATAFASLAQFLEEVLDAPREAQQKTLRGLIEVCHNFSVPISDVYKGLQNIANFDLHDRSVKKAKKSRFTHTKSS